ncbi:septum site-determining protein MinD [Halarchaeum solikamskense]|uniref:MinD/ParA family ATP-binding protein n=1 Tax=Halarchaeum nitratireducens TaxID=489913 RepID=UPI001B3AC457|nr:chromosome partitioning protein ParA [Halarchaeum solikamskense]MBP2250262.1 septum site-determining protein MinD [Halarchaeum solikamskense]
MILAVVGGKGGVGTSTVALELGLRLDAVVVDADLSMADLPTARGPDLHDVLAGRASPVEAVREGGAVSILPCGRTLAGARACDVGRLGGALGAVARRYGDVVVDCAAGMRADVGVPLAVADACVVVTAPARPAFADAIRVRELARSFDAGLAAIAYNRADGVPDAVERTLGAPGVAIPKDETVRRARRSGYPAGALFPDAPASAGFEALADAVRACGL